MVKSNKLEKYNIIGGGESYLGKITSVGDGYRVPDISEFVDGFEYERCDGYNWYKKKFQSFEKEGRVVEFQKGDVSILIPQSRARVKC
jgi:hypothetical protein